jgi:hypothetical protein
MMPGVFYGKYSERNNSYANAGNANVGRFRLGHTLVLPDGRVFRFVLNDGTIEVAGNLYQSTVSVANHRNVVPDTARAIGAVEVSATLGGTAAGIDIYAEGSVHANDATGQGYYYRINRAIAAGQAHAAADSSAILTVNLEAHESVQVALAATTSQVSFTRNKYHQVLIHPAPPTGNVVGVSPGVAAADEFYWSQVKGYASVLADGTLLEGLHAQASITTNGAVETLKRRIRTGGTGAGDVTDFVALLDQDSAEVAAEVGTVGVNTTNDITGPISINAPVVGMIVNPNATTEYALIDLNID